MNFTLKMGKFSSRTSFFNFFLLYLHCERDEETGRPSFFIADMEKNQLLKVLQDACSERGCTLYELSFDDDANVFDVTIDKEEAAVDLADCEYVHRAVLAAFDRNIEDYALTVGSRGISTEDADEILKTIND